MKKRPFLLTDFEDRALAACDDFYLEASTAQNILRSWYERSIPETRLRRAYARLEGLGLLGTYRKARGRIRRAPLERTAMIDLIVRGTQKGRSYLNLKRHVV